MDERRALQICVALAACLPVTSGLYDVVTGLAGHSKMTPGMAIVSYSTESHYRYLSGLLAAIGVGFWTTVPDIETKTARFRLLAAIVVAGGFARLLGVLFADKLTLIVIVALVMELGVVPVLGLWQARIAGRIPPTS